MKQSVGILPAVVVAKSEQTHHIFIKGKIKGVDAPDRTKKIRLYRFISVLFL
jgi:hypothetical protein